MHSAGIAARTFGRFDDAVALYQKVIARDPLRFSSRNNLGLALYYGGRLTEAEAEFRKLLEMRPGFAAAHGQLGKVLLAAGKPAAALSSIENESSAAWKSICLPMAYHALGRAAESDAAVLELTKNFADDWAYQIAEVHAFRGEIDQAFAWLDRALRPARRRLLGNEGRSAPQESRTRIRATRRFSEKMKLPAYSGPAMRIRAVGQEANRPYESNGAEERTRTSTGLLPLAPQASASANSATPAGRRKL